MKKRTGTTWIFACAIASTVAIGTVHAQQEVTADAAAKVKVRQAKAQDGKPRTVNTEKTFLRQVGQVSSSLRGGTARSAPERADSPVDISAELVGYLRRTVRDYQLEIDRRQPQRGAKPSLPIKPKARQPASPNTDQRPLSRKQFAALIRSLDKAEAELAGLNAANGQQPPAAREPQIRMLLDRPHMGTVYVASNKSVRFFAAQLVVVNATSKPVVVKRSQLQLTADGKSYKAGAISPQVKNHSYSSGTKGIHIGSLKFPEKLNIPAGDSGSMWLVFENLPLGNNVPAMSLNVPLAGRGAVLDINEFSRRVLGLSVERIGPRGSLGLLTIAGSMNRINLGGLVDELDQLVADKVIRVVIRWEKSAPPVDVPIGNWLQQQARLAGRNQQNNDNRFPIIPAAIRELHLAKLPIPNGRSPLSFPHGQNMPLRVHPTDRAAVSAALCSVYEVLSRDGLLREIEDGHRLTRAAALECGGGRLASEDLPLILNYAAGDASDMQRAALITLRHFGEPEAIRTLLKQAREETEPMADVAIESLAGSRYSAAQTALLGLLKNASPTLKKTIVVIVARYPRPLWSDVVYEFATVGDSQVSIVALEALVRIGHPQLIDVLGASLSRGTRSFQQAAFKILSVRTDSRSEELAIQYTLEQLEHSPPSPEMLQLLQRTRDRRAVPLLLAHFSKPKSNRSAIMNTLALIGDQSVAAVFLEQYPALNTNDKIIALNTLRQCRSPELLELAAEALLSKEGSLVAAACHGLQEDGSEKAVALLVVAFEKATHSLAWSYISNTLANSGTPEARAALVKGTHSTVGNRRGHAMNALRTLRLRSPGYQYIYRGQQFDRQKKWKEAIQQYSLAAQIDAQLPEAFSGRGNALLRQGKFQAAGNDFEKALRLDRFSSLSLTGLGIVRVIEGKTEEGLKLVEGQRKMFAHDATFAYNVACVYGRALEAVQKDLKAADRDKKIARYRKQALNDLKRSVKLGFRDTNWMKQDPDLKSLHDLEEFKTIHSPDAAGDKPKTAVPAVRTRTAVG